MASLGAPLGALCAVCVLPCWLSPARAELPTYQPAGAFSLPADTASYDLLPDGRAVAIAGSSIYFQDEVNASSFVLAGSLPAGFVAPFGASFLRVNPAGTRIAVGDNDFGPGAEVLVFDTASLSPGAPVSGLAYPIDNYDAHWHDDRTLFISGGNAADTLITRLDAAAGAHAPVITGIGGASGGVTTTATHLFTANGFSLGGPSATGDIKAFALGVLTPGAPLSFEQGGTHVATMLSGNTLGFDPFGHMLIGGGPGGYAGVLDGDELAAALGGGPLATTHLQLSPTTQDTHYIRLNPATGELLITTFGDPMVHRYAVIPAPAGAVVLGVMAGRGRRRG